MNNTTDSASEYDEVAPEFMAMQIQKRIAKVGAIPFFPCLKYP